MAEVEIFEIVQRLVSLESEYEEKIGGRKASVMVVTHAAESFLRSFRKFLKKRNLNVRATLPVEVRSLIYEFVAMGEIFEYDLMTVRSFSIWSWLFLHGSSSITEWYHPSLNSIAMAVKEIDLKMLHLDKDHNGTGDSNDEEEDEDIEEEEEEEEKPSSYRFPVVDMSSLHNNNNDDDVVGFEGYVSELSQLFVGFGREKLEDNNSNTPSKQEEEGEGKGGGSMLVVSIQGIGGVGKTTLARMVFNMSLIREEFDCRIWIDVLPSRQFRRDDVMLDILQQSLGSRVLLDNRFDQQNNKDQYYKEVSNTLRNYLKGKRYLLVLDDVEEIGVWESIRDVLPNGNGSIIIITTRHADLHCPIPECCHFHVVSLVALPMEKSWSLFCRNAMLHDPDTPEQQQQRQQRLTEALKPIGQAIVDRCGGLPLAIVLIARLLATKKPEPSIWAKVLKRMELHVSSSPAGSLLDGLLSLSYEDLPCSLRACFTYCSLFPEEFQVLPAKKLCRLWLAEGFLSKLPSDKTTTTAAHEGLEAGIYELDQLIRRNLIQLVSVVTDGEVETCRLLRPMRSFCTTLLESLALSVGLQTRRLFVSWPGDNYDVPTSSSSSWGVKLRSLRFVGRNWMMTPLNCQQQQHYFSNFFSSSLLGKFKLLRVLDIDNVHLKELPKKMDQLVNLRYLAFRDTKITKFQSIKALPKLLQTLDIRRTNVTGLPQSIKHLIHLQYLYLCSSYMDKVIPLPREIDATKYLVNLRKLTGVEITETLAQALGKLTQLRKLSGGQVREAVSTTLCTSLNKLPLLCSLTLKCDHLERLNLDTLEDYNKPSKIRLGGRLMKLDRIAMMKSLTCIHLWDSMLDQDQDPLFKLQHLPSLVHLTLHNAYRGRIIRCDPEGFPKLKKLSILRFPYLEEWGKLEGGAMKSLEELRLGYCPKLHQLPEGLADLDSLQLIQVVEVPIPIQMKGNLKMKLKRIPADFR